jgi:hypothetical protein
MNWKNGRPKGTVKAVWQKREWQLKKKKKKSTDVGKNYLKDAQYIVAMNRPEAPGIFLATSM